MRPHIRWPPTTTSPWELQDRWHEDNGTGLEDLFQRVTAATRCRYGASRQTLYNFSEWCVCDPYPSMFWSPLVHGTYGTYGTYGLVKMPARGSLLHVTLSSFNIHVQNMSKSYSCYECEHKTFLHQLYFQLLKIAWYNWYSSNHFLSAAPLSSLRPIHKIGCIWCPSSRQPFRRWAWANWQPRFEVVVWQQKEIQNDLISCLSA